MTQNDPPIIEALIIGAILAFFITVLLVSCGGREKSDYPDVSWACTKACTAWWFGRAEKPDRCDCDVY